MAANQAEVDGPQILETKPGPQTTEFWVTVFGNILGLVQILAGPVNVSDAKIVTVLAIINGAYSVGRGLAKQGVPAPVE